MPQTEIIPITRTVKVIVRHSAECKDKKQGSDWRQCKCLKSLLVYEGGGSGGNRRISAKTRTWGKAEDKAQEIRDSWDPVKQELKLLKAEKERKQIRIEEAVALYIEDMIARLGDNGTVAMMRSLLGHVDPATKIVVKDGHLFAWLKKQPTRISMMSEFTTPVITAWRASLVKAFGSDLTAANRWTMVRGFLNFCKTQGYVEHSVAHGVKNIKVKKGARTAIFTDKQYADILAAIALYDPENAPAATRKAWQIRLRAFLELMRWSAMDLIDAVQFRPTLIDKGVLRYRRQKSSELATVPLPDHVLQLLEEVPLERDSVGHDAPFRSRNIDLASDTAKWHRRLQTLFGFAGIKSVTTEHGRTRAPHPKMLRDTCAVYYLRRTRNIYTVAKILGHAKVATTEKHYLPFVQELQVACVEEARAAWE